MGRMIRFAFVLPGVYFDIRGMIPETLYPRVFLLCGLSLVWSNLEGYEPLINMELTPCFILVMFLISDWKLDPSVPCQQYHENEDK